MPDDEAMRDEAMSISIQILIAGLGIAGVLFGGGPGGANGKADVSAMEVRFTDESRLKLVVLDPNVEIVTPHGKLLIPIRDIQRLEIGIRMNAETQRRVQQSVNALASTVFQERETASAELLSLREKAYAGLQEALNRADPEVVRRAEALLAKLRETVAEDILEAPTHDVVHTIDSRITGQVTASTLRVRTTQFGEQQMKLADVRSLRMPGTPDVEADAKHALPDPGSLSNYAQQTGKTFQFQVTGANQGALYGTDTYTTDSTLAKAAVHAGVLKQGQTGVVRVTILPAQATFTGSTRNGVTSSEWGQYPAAFQFKRR
jgi:hypothetical protein